MLPCGNRGRFFLSLTEKHPPGRLANHPEGYYNHKKAIGVLVKKQPPVFGETRAVDSARQKSFFATLRSKQALIELGLYIVLRARQRRTLARSKCENPGACPGFSLICMLFLRLRAEKLCEAVGCTDAFFLSHRRFFDSLKRKYRSVGTSFCYIKNWNLFVSKGPSTRSEFQRLPLAQYPLRCVFVLPVWINCWD